MVALLAGCPACELEPEFAVDCDAIAPEPVPVAGWLLGLALPLISPLLGLVELEVALDVSAPATGAAVELGTDAGVLAAPFCSELLLAVVSPLFLLPFEFPVLAFTVS